VNDRSATVSGHFEPPSLSPADVSALEADRLEDMARAGRECLECQRVLARTQDNVVSELLRHEGTFYEWQHYPDGDVYDAVSHSQYYYHAHPKDDRMLPEHGHFHTFLRPLGMPAGIAPAAMDGRRKANGRVGIDNDALSHLVAISMDRAGRAIRLFTVNRWVTGETWYAASDVTRMLDRFVIDHAQPSWPVNRWVSCVMRLFRPDIEALLTARDESIVRWSRDRPGRLVYEDRDLEIASQMEIDIERQLRRVEGALADLPDPVLPAVSVQRAGAGGS